MAESPWGPVLGGMRPRAARRLAGSAPVGYAQLVEGMIEQLELQDLKDPLAYLHGYYRAVSDLPITADRGVIGRERRRLSRSQLDQVGNW